MIRRLAAVALLLALAACEPAAPERPGTAPVPPADLESCGGAPYLGLVGRDATALERVLILREVRVIRPGTAVTMDFRPERINFSVGEDGRIARVHCG